MTKSSIAQGTIYLTAASFVFLLGGYILNIFLGRFLGPSGFGIYGIIITIVGIINIVQTSGLPQAVAKYVSEQAEQREEILLTGIRIQFYTTAVMTALFVLFAKQIAFALHDESIYPYLLLAACIPPVYSFLSLYSGFYNGLHDFRMQAIMQAIYAVAKVTAVLIASSFLHLTGAIIGSIIAPLSALLYGVYTPHPKAKPFPAATMLRYSYPLIASAFLYTLLQSIDIFFIKAILKSNTGAGLYTASQTIAEIPNFALGAFATVLFPNISYHHKRGELEHIRSISQKTLRYVLMLLLPFVMTIAVTSEKILQVLYSHAYTPAAPTLSILVYAAGTLTLFGIFTHILNAVGKPGTTLGITFLGVAATAVSCIFLIPHFALNGAAYATLIGSVAATIVAWGLVYKAYGVYLPPVQLIRIVIASSVAAYTASLLPFQNFALPLTYGIAAIIYGLILIITKEVTDDDWHLMLSMTPWNKTKI
jgi:stage V sporulation protein B